MIKLKAPNTFECERSCGAIIEKGEDTWMADDHQMVCRACAINDVYGPPPEPQPGPTLREWLAEQTADIDTPNYRGRGA